MAGPTTFKICILITENREDELFLVKLISSNSFDSFKSELFAHHPELIENKYKMYYKQGESNGLFGSVNCLEINFNFAIFIQEYIQIMVKYV